MFALRKRRVTLPLTVTPILPEHVDEPGTCRCCTPTLPETARAVLGVVPNPDLKPVNLSIGEPKHATPTLVTEALTANLGGLAQYPATQGSARRCARRRRAG